MITFPRSLRRLLVYLLLLLWAVMTAGCAALGEPPRLATATARAALPPTPTATPFVPPTPAATPTTDPALAAAPNPSLTVWVNETSPAHRAALQQMAADFTEESGIDVALMQVAPLLLPDLVHTAVLSGTLPDVIIHPMAYTIGWAERGILNPAAADAAIETIGRQSFDPDALALLAFNGETAAVPIDGYQQLLIYRADWAAQRDLPPPTSYANMLAFAEAVFDLENSLTTGFIIPTESNLVTTHQAFEHIATANGCELIDEQGEVQILSPACRDALDFYFSIVNQFSPPGVQTDTSARNAYLAGRTGMIMAPPGILPQLAGLDPDAPPICPECAEDPAYLAANSGITPRITGASGASATFGVINTLGITGAADVETAVRFAEFWLNEGYETWLAVDSPRKAPMRWGTADEPRRFIDAWGERPLAGSDLSLTDLYGAELVAALRDGVADSSRWALPQGQGALLTKLYEELTFSIVLQEMLSGYFDSSQTIEEAYNRIVELIPDYPFAEMPEPTATPES